MRRTALALALRVPSEERRRAADQARVPRTRVRARERAHSARGQEAFLPNPAARSEPSPQARARIRGRVFFGYFLVHEQEKVTRPPGGRTEKRRDASRFSRSAKDRNRRARSKWIPAFAGMTSRRWIPAFAGMTSRR